MKVTYDKDQRQDAKEKKSGLFTIDIDRRASGGCRITMQGLASEAELSKLDNVIRKLVRLKQ